MTPRLRGYSSRTAAVRTFFSPAAVQGTVSAAAAAVADAVGLAGDVGSEPTRPPPPRTWCAAATRPCAPGGPGVRIPRAGCAASASRAPTRGAPAVAASTAPSWPIWMKGPSEGSGASRLPAAPMPATTTGICTRTAGDNSGSAIVMTVDHCVTFAAHEKPPYFSSSTLVRTFTFSISTNERP